MTIAAGFVCSDGLLFASDTLYSGTHHQFGRKLWTFQTDTVQIVCGGAGTKSGLQRTIDEIEGQLQPGLDRWGVLRVIESALQLVDEQLKPEFWDKTRLLVGTREAGKTQLHENDGGSYALTRLNGATQCVGAGDALGRYFAESLFRPVMSIKWAKIVAAHLVKNAKTHAPASCGGDTHLVELPDSGDVQTIMDQAVVRALEAYLAPLEKVLGAVLPDHTTNDDTVLARLRMVTAAVDKALRSYVIEPTTGRAVFQSGSTSVLYDPAQTPLTLRLSPTQPPPDPEEK